MNEKNQRRSTVKLDIRLLHKLSPYIHTQPPVPPSIPRGMKFKMSPRKLKIAHKIDLNSLRDYTKVVTKQQKTTTNLLQLRNTSNKSVEQKREHPENGKNDDAHNNDDGAVVTTNKVRIFFFIFFCIQVEFFFYFFLCVYRAAFIIKNIFL